MNHAIPSHKKRLGKRKRPRIRCLGPARGQNTNDDDDVDDEDNNSADKIKFTDRN